MLLGCLRKGSSGQTGIRTNVKNSVSCQCASSREIKLRNPNG